MLTASPLVSLPPGPATLPAQQARQWIERPLDLLDACAREFGDAFTLQLGGLGATVMFSHPEAVKTIFRAPSAILRVSALQRELPLRDGGQRAVLAGRGDVTGESSG